MNYLKNNLKTYVNSFKNKNIVIILALNILFVTITTILVKLTKTISAPWIKVLEKADLDLALQSEAKMQELANSLRGFVLFVILTTIIFILLIIINWSFFQGVIYNILLKKKFNMKYLGKFLLLNIIWFIPWTILLFIIIAGSKANYLLISFYTTILIFIHFSSILYILFTKNSKLKEIKNALKIGILKIHHFILPYIIITITFIILSQLNLLNINILAIGLVYLLFFSWIQNYLKEITTEIV